MKKIFAALVRHSDSRHIYDPVYEESYLVQGENNRLTITRGYKLESTLLLSTEDLDQAVQVLRPVFERFRLNIEVYLNKVKENTYWRFYEVSYGVDIKVIYTSAVDGTSAAAESCRWEVWMGDDLSFHTNDKAEAGLYIKGLISEYEPWWEREFRKLYEQIKSEEHKK
ncbi:hypothetical protein ACFO25_00115 [Paenactinomyces guangxiensis]|uniref:Uncharacterized protein n=1 Tax=Paenactinomyces guangxiensis TaxID=1490290 RepID=A0A7W2A930_9BACL|nr:hypothetical protein [Paenactinomyces guangxiensis]MBA4495275.1 hypothetical protein [Paenactinomyces guangxiensis]MBH8592359.1 hypothetical protein [Paenactinomyces guangxiensis]